MISGRIRFLPRERMALAQIYRFLQRERMVRKQLYSASISCPLVAALAASCRAGNFGEKVCAFLLWWRLVDLGAALSLAGPTVWKEEELHRLDIGGSFVCSHASAWRAAVFCCGLGISPTVLNPLGRCLVALSGVPLGFLGASWALFGLSWRLLGLLEVN